MNADPELDTWRRDWQAQTFAPLDLRRSVTWRSRLVLALKGGNGKTAPQTAPEAVEEAPTRA